MPRKQHTLQLVALVAGKLSLLVSVLSSIFLYLKVNELGASHPVSASFLASVFFFAFVGLLLCFVANLVLVKPDLIGMLRGLVPGVPEGVSLGVAKAHCGRHL